ncbi:MarR family winged helix-turn-helix transcriptional regulator [Geodermatophilus sp. SYSU D00691]
MADDDPAVLGELVLRLGRLQRHRWRDALAPWDLTPHQARALRVVTGRDGTRLSELAEALHIAPRSATEVVDGLEERGLVERTADPRDRRAVVVRPTATGRRVRGEVDTARAADSRELFGRLPTADRAALERILRTLVDEG